VARLVEKKGCLAFPSCGHYLVWDPIGRIIYEMRSHEKENRNLGMPATTVFEERIYAIEGQLSERYDNLQRKEAAALRTTSRSRRG